jgi:hypothetical protein
MFLRCRGSLLGLGHGYGRTQVKHQGPAQSSLHQAQKSSKGFQLTIVVWGRTSCKTVLGDFTNVWSSCPEF